MLCPPKEYGADGKSPAPLEVTVADFRLSSPMGKGY